MAILPESYEALVPSQGILYPLEERQAMTFEDVFTDVRTKDFDNYRLYATTGIFEPDSSLVDLAVRDATSRAVGEIGLCSITEHFRGSVTIHPVRYRGGVVRHRGSALRSAEYNRALNGGQIVRIGEIPLEEPQKRAFIQRISPRS